jgi:hypothetical protein
MEGAPPADELDASIDQELVDRELNEIEAVFAHTWLDWTRAQRESVRFSIAWRLRETQAHSRR